MARARRARARHIQQELFQHGGRRRGAGRKPKHGRAGSPHRKRPVVKPYHALHVVIRAVPAVGGLRKRAMYKAVREATITAALRGRFRIVHLSIQRTHIHMLVEAGDTKALSRGMQGFEIAAARNINTALGSRGRRRCGQVFADRYHLEVITSPRQAHHALRYVLVKLEKASRGPGGSGEHVAGRSVLERQLVPGLAGARGQARDVADPSDL